MSPARGRELWAELHALPFTLPPSGSLSEPERLRVLAWLEQFGGRVAAAEDACACSGHWRDLTLRRPPDLRSAGTLYFWTCAVHDMVNHRLGKPLWLPFHPEAERFADPVQALCRPGAN
jgi:hypothetical protein